MILFILLGCAEKSDSGSSNDLETIECSQLNDEETCLAAAPDCAAIYGWPLDEQGEGFCSDESIYEQERLFAGCTAMLSSLTVETTAGPSDGSECWMFSSSTIPEDWIDCEQLIVGNCEND